MHQFPTEETGRRNHTRFDGVFEELVVKIGGRPIEVVQTHTCF